MITHFETVERCIIIETTGIVKWFISELSKCTVAEYNIPELISEAISLMKSQSHLNANIGFMTERLYEHYQYKTNSPETAKIISLSWAAFVGLLIDVYTVNNLWDKYGISNYYFKTLSGYDIVLAFYNPGVDALSLSPAPIFNGVNNDNHSATGIAA